MIAAAGSMSKAEGHFAAMLADSTVWRAWVGATTAEQAMSRIHFHALPPPEGDGEAHTLDALQAFRPFAIVYTDPANGGFARSRDTAEYGGVATWSESGRIVATFEADVPADMTSDPGAALRWFTNQVGQVLDELCTLAGGAGYLGFDRVELLMGPMLPDPGQVVEVGHCIKAYFSFDWSN